MTLALPIEPDEPVCRHCSLPECDVACEDAARDVARWHDLAADVRAAEQRAERAEAERDAAIAMLERVCAAEHDWDALEAAKRDARKLLAKQADVCSDWSDAR